MSAFHMLFVIRTREEAFSEIAGLIQRLPDREEQNYMAALILGLSARMLSKEQIKRLEEVLKMTDILKSIQQEAWEEGLQKGRQEGKRELVEQMLKRGASVTDIVKLTGMSEEEVEEIQRKASQ